MAPKLDGAQTNLFSNTGIHWARAATRGRLRTQPAPIGDSSWNPPKTAFDPMPVAAGATCLTEASHSAEETKTTVMVSVGATDAAPLRPPRNHLQFRGRLRNCCGMLDRGMAQQRSRWVSPPHKCSTWNGAEFQRVIAPFRSAGLVERPQLPTPAPFL